MNISYSWNVVNEWNCDSGEHRDLGRPGLEGGGEGGAPTAPERRADPPPRGQSRVNKASTHAAHLPGAATSRPQSSGRPGQVKPDQKNLTEAKRQRRRPADAGQARAASSGRAVPAAPEVFCAARHFRMRRHSDNTGVGKRIIVSKQLWFDLSYTRNFYVTLGGSSGP
eukprot:XP_017451680.1 PREDICTED: LOW QUALITY PROTEIN: uncharacterized protein ARIH2OS [Rattus norvegicus]